MRRQEEDFTGPRGVSKPPNRFHFNPKSLADDPAAVLGAARYLYTEHSSKFGGGLPPWDTLLHDDYNRKYMLILAEGVLRAAERGDGE